MLLAAGQTIIANTGQRAVGGFNMGFLLISISGIIVSNVMLRSSIFSKMTAYIGIFAFAISIADYFRIVFLPHALSLLLIFAILSGLLLFIWFIFVGQRLIQLGNGISEE